MALGEALLNLAETKLKCMLTSAEAETEMYDYVREIPDTTEATRIPSLLTATENSVVDKKGM